MWIVYIIAENRGAVNPLFWVCQVYNFSVIWLTLDDWVHQVYIDVFYCLPLRFNSVNASPCYPVERTNDRRTRGTYMPGETPAPVGGMPTNPTPDPTNPTPATPTSQPGETPLKWEDWLNQQPDTIKSLIGEHTSGLKTALQSERGTRGSLERQLNELQKQLKGNESAQAEVARIQSQLAEENTRGEFYEAAHVAGATNLRAAYLLAKADGLIDDKGKFRIDDIKSRYPEFFASPKAPLPPGNAGSGAGVQPPRLSGNAAVNHLIRSAAGIRT